MGFVNRTLTFQCPECGDPDALECRIKGTPTEFSVSLVAQTCLCDPFHAWEDVWEQARERVFEQGAID
jgi:hypothetical protein